MGRHAEITQAWGDDDYAFRLGIKELVEHDEKCDAGPAYVAKALIDGTWRLKHIRETVRLGLIGGGMPPAQALALTKRYVDNRPLRESIPLAIAILMAVLYGPEDDKIPKAPPPDQVVRGAEDDASSRSRADVFPSPPSTETPRPSASRPSRPTVSASGSSTPP